MSKQKQREQFIAALTRALPDKPLPFIEREARALMRWAHTHGRLAEESCNGHPMQSSPHIDATRLRKLQEKWNARIEREEARTERIISNHAKALGVTADFGGDPRGYTVKLQLPDGNTNTWGRDGYGVPQ